MLILRSRHLTPLMQIPHSVQNNDTTAFCSVETIVLFYAYCMLHFRHLTALMEIPHNVQKMMIYAFVLLRLLFYAYFAFQTLDSTDATPIFRPKSYDLVLLKLLFYALFRSRHLTAPITHSG